MKIITLILFLLLPNLLLSHPAQVLIIRHGEKINDNIPHLSPTGYQRAKALVRVFNERPELNQFGPPVAIYAQMATPNRRSVRSIETVTPLARHFEQNIITKFEAEEIKHMVDEIFNNPAYTDRTVIICWSQQRIPRMARLLGAKQAPKNWKGEVFDRIWKISYEDDEVIFENLPQRALPKDSLI